jgi:hypothetical protein
MDVDLGFHACSHWVVAKVLLDMGLSIKLLDSMDIVVGDVVHS